jgi:hypothetical protein
MGAHRHGHADRHSWPCVYCGGEAGTDEHVPPTSLFEGSPVDRITVRACEGCNGGKNEAEEKFRQIVSISAGVASDVERQLWRRTLRGLQKNRRHMREIAQRSTPIAGSEAMFVRFPAEEMTDVPSRIVRSLYFHERRATLPKDAQITVDHIWPTTLEIFLATVPGMKEGRIGGDQFVYRFAINDDEPLESFWQLAFQRSLFLECMTGPAGWWAAHSRARPSPKGDPPHSEPGEGRADPPLPSRRPFA